MPLFTHLLVVQAADMLNRSSILRSRSYPMDMYRCSLVSCSHPISGVSAAPSGAGHGSPSMSYGVQGRKIRRFPAAIFPFCTFVSEAGQSGRRAALTKRGRDLVRACSGALVSCLGKIALIASHQTNVADPSVRHVIGHARVRLEAGPKLCRGSRASCDRERGLCRRRVEWHLLKCAGR